LNLELQHAFKIYDVDKNGTMDIKEFKQVLKDLGKRDVTEDQVSKMMSSHDQNKDGTLSWTEFLEVSKIVVFK
jgi:Ca2+-binding EF-hand superfamily protein